MESDLNYYTIQIQIDLMLNLEFHNIIKVGINKFKKYLDLINIFEEKRINLKI
jgi:hypothetical protein